MDKELLSFNQVIPNSGLIEEIWNFNVENLHAMDDIKISQYVIALAQWLVYYRSQINEIKARMNQLQSDLDFFVSACMNEKTLKEHKTQTAARDYIIRANAESSLMNDNLQKLKFDLIKVDGIDKAVSELIAAFKREMTRRENELYTIRKERYSN